MKYKEGCSRYDIKTKDTLTKFPETGKVPTKFAEREPLYKNICYLNSTRQKATRDCCDLHLRYDSEGITRIGRNLHKPGNHPGDVMENFIAFSDFILMP